MFIIVALSKGAARTACANYVPGEPDIWVGMSRSGKKRTYETPSTLVFSCWYFLSTMFNLQVEYVFYSTVQYSMHGSLVMLSSVSYVISSQILWNKHRSFMCCSLLVFNMWVGLEIWNSKMNMVLYNSNTCYSLGTSTICNISCASFCSFVLAHGSEPIKR